MKLLIRCLLCNLLLRLGLGAPGIGGDKSDASFSRFLGTLGIPGWLFLCLFAFLL